MKRYKIQILLKHPDKRGVLVELLRTDKIGTFKQVYFASIKPGQYRGAHWHEKRTEWFCLVRGTGIYEIQDFLTGEKIRIPINEKIFKQIEISPFIYHRIINTGKKELLFVSGISDLYDEKDTDTFKPCEPLVSK